MKKLPNIDQDYLLNTLQELLHIPSPTGYTVEAITYLEDKLAQFPEISYHRNAKGSLLASWFGDLKTSPRGLTAHVDTLGAMVKEIKSNGRLKLTQLGGYPWNTIEGEGCGTAEYTCSGNGLCVEPENHFDAISIGLTYSGVPAVIDMENIYSAP